MIWTFQSLAVRKVSIVSPDGCVLELMRTSFSSLDVASMAWATCSGDRSKEFSIPPWNTARALLPISLDLAQPARLAVSPIATIPAISVLDNNMVSSCVGEKSRANRANRSTAPGAAVYKTTDASAHRAHRQHPPRTEARNMDRDEVLIFGGSGSPQLTRRICEFLNQPVGRGEVLRYPDGNLCVRVLENVRGRHVYLVQSTAFPANDNFMELIFWIDAFKRASCASVT